MEKEILNEYFIGNKKSIITKSNFDSSKYFLDFTNLYLISISEHIFTKIKKINWSEIFTEINRNGDLVTKIYTRAKLPSMSIEYNNVINKIINKIINCIKLYIYTDIYINFDTYEFSKYLKELYIEYEDFNYNLINLPEELKIHIYFLIFLNH